MELPDTQQEKWGGKLAAYDASLIGSGSNKNAVAFCKKYNSSSRLLPVDLGGQLLSKLFDISLVFL